MRTDRVIRIHEKDNVAVALQELQPGEMLTCKTTKVTVSQKIPFGHKIALADLKEGENVIKYGHPIGHTTTDIHMGEHIHTHNLKTNLGELLTYEYHPDKPLLENYHRSRAERADMAQFLGYERPDGRVGIRNEVWIVPTVGCVDMTVKRLEEEAAKRFGNRVDGIHAFTHNMGCSQLAEDHLRTQKLLSGIIRNPNAGAVLVVSLGCENNDLESFIPVLGKTDPDRVRFLVAQDEEDEIGAGIELLDQLTRYAGTFRRTPVNADKLVVGFKCGGSDAFSGITANALCGKINDKIIRMGGSTVLTEVPEMFGAESLLMDRAVSEEVFEKIVKLINDFKSYFIKYGQTIYENPSPGNKKGGISTLEDKSLGCVQKGGSAPVTDVLDYGEQVSESGLNLLIGPGNDQVSCTNLVASGVQLIVFTTGRGNPFGSPVPTVKVASNPVLARKKQNWIDYDAGKMLEGNRTENVPEGFFQYILDVASGKIQTKNEQNGYREISIFRDGVIL